MAADGEETALSKWLLGVVIVAAMLAILLIDAQPAGVQLKWVKSPDRI